MTDSSDSHKAALSPPGLSLKRKVVLISLITLLVLSVSFGVSEIYVRRTSKTGYITPEILKNRSVQYVPSLFARHVFPQKEITAYGGEGEHGTITYYINEKGYRGHNFEANKPPGTIRIIFYGGSHVFDIKNTEPDDWPHRIERILNQNGFPQVEVINAGIPGHASFDSFGRLWSEGHDFIPDYVVFCNAWNDIKKQFRSSEPLLRQFGPYVEDSDPRLDYQSGLDRFLCEHSQLFVRLRQRYYDWKINADTEGDVRQGEPRSETETRPEALAQYKLNLQMFIDCARDTGAVPVLMTEARLAVRDSPESREARKKKDAETNQPLTNEALLTAYESIERTLRDVAQEKNVILLEDSKELNGKEAYFADHVHLTEKGSAELARLIAPHLAVLLKEKK